MSEANNNAQTTETTPDVELTNTQKIKIAAGAALAVAGVVAFICKRRGSKQEVLEVVVVTPEA